MYILVNNENKCSEEVDTLSTVEKLAWGVFTLILVAQYGLGIMANPIPTELIYALGATALGINHIKGKK